MRRSRILAVLVSLLLVAACAGSDDTNADTAETGETVPTTAPVGGQPTAPAAPTDEPEAPASSTTTPAAGEPGESSPTAIATTPDASPTQTSGEGFESVYTDVDLDSCAVIESFPESGGSVRECPGYGDTPLFVSEGDGRFDLDAGVLDEDFLTGGRAFNTIGDTVEWRLRDGEPFAVIARFDFDDGFEIDSSELAVITVGTEERPGCLVAWVRPDALPDQNTAARDIADERAVDFACELEPGGPELPAEFLGRFAPDADECAEIVSLNEVVVAPDRLDFYYGYADIRSIAPSDDGFRIEATLYQLEGALEIVPEPATYTLHPAVDGVLFDYVGTQTAPELLERCDGSPAGGSDGDSPELTTEAVEFADGATGAEVAGSISGFEIDDYTVEARTDQQITASLLSDGPAVVLVIEEDIASDGSVTQIEPDVTEPLLDDDGNELGWTWSGAIPADATYRVRVVHSGPAANGGSTSDYELVIEITG